MIKQTTTSTPLNTKNHYEVLDGLRGVAAIGVVIFHFSEWLFPDASKNFIGHGFLAVDFFFCLSGFVISYAYDDRMQQMSLIQFFKLRLIRLHPLVVIGSVLGIVFWFWGPSAFDTSKYSVTQIILLSITSLLLIPMPTMADRLLNLFGLNAPSWSLFWEYIANILYATILHKLSEKALKVLLIFALLFLAYTAYVKQTLTGGWGGTTFWDGLARLGYSFLIGILIQRKQWIIQNKIGFIGLSIMLLCMLMMPYVGKYWVSELLVVLFYSPLLVSLGAGTINYKATQKIAKLSGEISYPLYMCHYWTNWYFAEYLSKTKPNTSEIVLVVIFSTLALILFAYIIMKYFDKPIRTYLLQKYGR